MTDTKLLGSLASRLREKMNEKDEKNTELKEIQKEIDSLKIALLHEIKESGFKNIKTDKGTFSPSKHTNVKTVDANLLRKHCMDMGREELLTVNNQRLKSYIKELPADYDLEAMGVSVSEFETLSITK